MFNLGTGEMFVLFMMLAALALPIGVILLLVRRSGEGGASASGVRDEWPPNPGR